MPKPLVFASGQMPGACANDHYYAPHTHIIGWMTCGCTKARNGGHHWVACQVPGCGDIWYDPPHDRSVAEKMWD